MGLDMYLSADRYIWTSDRKALSKKLPGVVPKGFEVKSIQIEVGYWRKANHIHKWFVDNVQGGVDECQSSYVHPDKLWELKAICEQVLDDHSLAAVFLPTHEGFFFGSTEYDEGYFLDVEDTIQILDKALSLDPGEWTIEYRASW